MKKFKLDKKKVLIIAITLAVLVFAGIATLITINLINNKPQKSPQQNQVVKKAAADTKKDEGVKASISGDADKAKELLLQAQAEYKALNDTNNVVDTEAQLYFIEHPSTPPAASDTTSN